MTEEKKHNLKEVAHRISVEEIKTLLPGQIFVFGSNESGRHGKGAAKQALTWGAKWGQASGLQGRTYGIPTKDRTIQRILSVDEIKSYVDTFIDFARQNPQMTFLVTEIGCGLSKYKPKDIAPLFETAVGLENVHLPIRFWHKLGYSIN
jgi:hypothetical protein